MSGLNYQGFLGSWKMRACCLLLIGTLGSNDAYGNEKVIKTIGNKQNNNFARASRTLFLYISFPFLQDYDVKMPNFVFYGEGKQAKTKFYFCF